jgi:arylsulfatase A-like enzyme
MTAKYFYDAEPSWPEPARVPDGSANVLAVVLDDVGYAQLGCYGSDIATPNIDRLAAGGIQYTNFHTTSVCSSTRASLLTGRNHHRNGMGRVIELATGFDGYNSNIPKSNGFLSEVLRDAGYATMAVGKWHLTPEYECHAAASRERWPLGRGFERFYGFMSGENHQFAPTLYCDNHVLRRDDTGPGSNYHLTEDLVLQARQFIYDLRSVNPEKPFFLYFCPGACHSPHQAPRQYVDRYRQRFDQGWDEWRREVFGRQRALGLFPAATELSPRPPWVPPWSSLSGGQQRLYARYMEAFAAYLTHTDECLGRLFDALDAVGVWQDTLVVVMSDNGASSEGGPSGSVNDLALWNRMAVAGAEEGVEHIDDIGGPYVHNNYPWGWTVAGNTPFRRWKREVHEGGVADPLIVHWPARIRVPGLRRQYVHVIDLMPSVLSSVSVKVPKVVGGVEQSPLDGVDVSGTFFDPGMPSPRQSQYYEMFGCRAMYKSGWKAVTYHEFDNPELMFAEDAWELYHVDLDPSECHDLAASEPERLKDIVEDWWVEAARNNVLPLDNRLFSEWVLSRPTGLPARGTFVYYPGISLVPEVCAVNVRRRWHLVSAEIQVPPDVALPNGTIISHGSALGGWAFYMVDGRLRYVHNLLGRCETRVETGVVVNTGRHRAWFEFTPEGAGGQVRVGLDEEELASGAVPVHTPVRFSLTGAGLTCGYSNMLPVDRGLVGPFELNVCLEHVSVEVKGREHVDAEGEARAACASQ